MKGAYVRFWCISTSKENWKICKDNWVWGMDARYYITMKDFMNEGDKAVVYTHGNYFQALIQFKGDVFYSEEDIGWKKGREPFLFPYRIKFEMLLEPTNSIKISYSTVENSGKAEHNNPNPIDSISFIADKGKTWNQYLQVSIIRLTEEDFNIVKKLMEGGQNEFTR